MKSKSEEGFQNSQPAGESYSRRETERIREAGWERERLRRGGRFPSEEHFRRMLAREENGPSVRESIWF